MRPWTLALGLVVVGPAWVAPARAQSNQAEDDEKPTAGEATSKNRSSNRDGVDPNAVESDTPPRDDAEPPVTRSTKRLSRDSAGAPLRLKGRGDRGEIETPNSEGVYAGVSIGGEGLPPHPPKLPVKGPQRMTWPGFQVRDGVPTVFLQTTGTPNYTVQDSPGAIHVTLRGTKIQLRNNRRPLKVAEFGTAITEVSAVPHGNDVVVTIKHKGEATHRERVEPSAGGFQLLVVELPANK
jgi:hypothetical protein